MPAEIIVISEPMLIPIWFYLYSVIAYGAVSLISFLISFFAFKLYKASSLASNKVISISFLALGIAFLFLTATSACTYFYEPYLKPLVVLSAVNYFGYNIYYLASLVAYVVLGVSHFPKKIKNKLFMFYLPLWYINSTAFHAISIVVLLYIVAVNIFSLLKKSSKKISRLNSCLVTVCFISMLAFHSLLLLTEFNVNLYLAALAILAVGFGSLLTMFIRVNEE